MHKSEDSFMLKNSNKEFLERQKNIFGQLNTLKCDLNKDEEMDIEERPVPKKRSRGVMKQFRGKESIFKVPQDPASYMRTIPDFKKNPHKWRKYSLADVKEEDMSDASNTKAALSFLNELKHRSNEGDTDDVSEVNRKIIFKKNRSSLLKDTTEISDPAAKPSFRSSKVIMPEYVIGQKIKKEKKNKNLKTIGSIQLKLDHLYESNE